MQGTRLNFGGCTRSNRLKSVVAAIFSMACFATLCIAQQAGQKTFSSAEDASAALVAAVQNNDEKAMIEILGPEGKQIVSSGDEIEDARGRASFVQVYQEMHRLVVEPDGTTDLIYRCEKLDHTHTVGEQRWFVVLRYCGGTRKKSCTGELAGMRCRPFAFARSSWRRKRSSMPRSTTNTPRRS